MTYLVLDYSFSHISETLPCSTSICQTGPRQPLANPAGSVADLHFLVVASLVGSVADLWPLAVVANLAIVQWAVSCHVPLSLARVASQRPAVSFHVSPLATIIAGQ